MKLTILRGVSGSGKSTYARQQNALVVSRDDFRAALFGSDGPDYYAVDKEILRDRENTITIVCDAAIAGALKAGKDVVVDNTNVEWKFVKQIAKIGYRYGAEVEVKVFDVPLGEAVKRDANRAAMGGRSVGHRIISQQYERFQKTKNLQLDPVIIPKPYTGTPGKPKALLLDVDGSIAHMVEGGRGPFDWKRVHEDTVDESVRLVVNAVADSGITILVMSGRDGSCYDLTYEWLVENDVQFEDMFMRAAGDMRPDNIIKAELFEEHVRDNYDVIGVIDDRAQVVDFWKRLGLKVFNVSGLDNGEF